MAADEQAFMDLIIPLMKDAGALKGWLNSNCRTETVSGDELDLFWGTMDMGSDNMPETLEVCKSSNDKISTLIMYVFLKEIT